MGLAFIAGLSNKKQDANRFNKYHKPGLQSQSRINGFCIFVRQFESLAPMLMQFSGDSLQLSIPCHECMSEIRGARKTADKGFLGERNVFMMERKPTGGLIFRGKRSTPVRIKWMIFFRAKSVRCLIVVS